MRQRRGRSSPLVPTQQRGTQLRRGIVVNRRMDGVHSRRRTALGEQGEEEQRQRYMQGRGQVLLAATRRSRAEAHPRGGSSQRGEFHGFVCGTEDGDAPDRRAPPSGD
jgi:hypothetical protein